MRVKIGGSIRIWSRLRNFPALMELAGSFQCFLKFGEVKSEVVWMGEHMDFIGLEEVLDRVYFVVTDGLMEIVQEDGEDMVGWRGRYGEFFWRWSSF